MGAFDKETFANIDVATEDYKFQNRYKCIESTLTLAVCSSRHMLQ